MPTVSLRASIAAAVILLMAVPAALAADRGESTPLDLPAAGKETAASGGGGAGLVRTIVGLAVVLAVIYGLYWVLKQVKAAREGTAAGRGMQPVASVPLGANRSVHLVRVGRELVLLGVSEHALVHLRTYDEAEARAAGLLDDSPFGGDPPTAPPSAGQAVRDLMERLQRRTVRG